MNRRTGTFRSLALAAGGIVLFAIAGLVWPSGGGPTGVAALGIATATPTATATPPALQPPAAPSNLDIDGTNLVWDDNSDNEDGFRVRVSVGGGPPEVVATVPADSTSAPLPDVTPPDPCDTVAFDVVAFNDAGESEATPALGFIATDCDGLPATPTPTATVAEIVSPSTGAGPGGSDPRWPFVAAGFGLALVALGSAAALRLRARAGECKEMR